LHRLAIRAQRTDDAATQKAIRGILLIARVDVALLLVVVMDMLMKPFS